MHRGVYAVGHPVTGVRAKLLAAVLACGPGAVLSHRSAAALWNIRPSATPLVDVTVPTRAGRSKRRGIRVHRSSTLGDEDATRLHGIAITSVARTILDLAQVLPKREVDKAIDLAVRLRLFDLASLHAAVERAPGRRRVEIDPEPTFTRSELELLLCELCERHGLPRPRVNHYVGGYEVDFHWPRQRLIAETDGRATHLTRAAFERDRARDAQLTVAGWRVVRFTYLQITREPEKVAAVLGKLLGRETA